MKHNQQEQISRNINPKVFIQDLYKTINYEKEKFIYACDAYHNNVNLLM